MSEENEVTVDTLDQGIRRLAEQGPDRAIADLTTLANRAIIELHKIARQEASRRRGEPDWGSWARLANAVRSGVLQVAAIRDSVKGLPVVQPPAPTPDQDEASS